MTPTGQALTLNITIFIPFYQGNENACAFLASLPPVKHLYVLDGSPKRLSDDILQLWQMVAPRLQYVHYSDVSDALQLCRRCYYDLNVHDCDLWIIDAASEPQPGTIEELHAVLGLHERHAIAIPRSNSPGFGAIPLSRVRVSAGDALRIWRAVHLELERFRVIPHADPLCMMIHHNALKHFDIFREGESAPEYCLRINRYGYSTVLCNRAFVGRLGAGGQCPTAEEWATYLAFHVDPVEYFSSLSVPHKPRILFDLSHLKPHYYGTAEFGLTLLREIHLLMQNTVDMVVDIHPSCRDFFLPELHGYQFYDPQSEPKVFDLAFKPTQINSWEELERLNRRAPRVAYTIQDMIAVRCSYLGSPGRDLLFREAAELSDQVFTISQSVVDDFNAITGSHRKLEVIHHGTTFGVSARERCAGDYILIMGNSYVHKGIAEALTALEGINLPVIVIGKAADPGFTAANVRCLTSGALSHEKVRELLAGARIFVYPSHYEGFGLPVLDALALGKPVVVLDNQTNRELLAITRSSNLHVLQTVNELKATVDRLIRETPNPVQRLRRWRDAGRDYSRALQDMLSRPINTQLLRTRWTLLQERGL